MRLLIAAVFAGAAAAASAGEHFAGVVGHPECAECHEKSAAVWEKTGHAASFTEVHRSRDGREIARKMGVKRIKAAAGRCAGCHFTAQAQAAGKAKVVAGVSCESCHAPAADWLKIHSEFSGKEEADETPQEEAARWADAEAAGMIRPRAIARLAANCVGCHIVPDEELVNVGGHEPGSDFELVSWLLGEVRHNVWYTEENNPPDQNRLRRLFVVGAAAELEASLRALAAAAEKARYAKAMAKRVHRARNRFAEIAAALAIPEWQAAAQTAQAAALKLNNAEELNAAAAAIGAAIDAASAHDGGGWAAVDPMLPTEYRGEIFP